MHMFYKYIDKNGFKFTTWLFTKLPSHRKLRTSASAHSRSFVISALNIKTPKTHHTCNPFRYSILLWHIKNVLTFLNKS